MGGLLSRVTRVLCGVKSVLLENFAMYARAPLYVLAKIGRPGNRFIPSVCRSRNQ